MAQYPEAIEAGKHALQLNPDHYAPYTVLARAYKRATRFKEARDICRQSKAKGFDDWDIHGLLYEIAFAEGDSATMAEQVAMEKGRPTETWMLEYQALGASTAGQLKQFRVLIEQAIEAAKAQGPDAADEVSAFFNDYVDTLYIFGLKQEAHKIALAAPKQEDNATELAESGDFEAAANLATAMSKHHPSDTSVNEIYLPLTQALIDLGLGKPDEAIIALQPDLPYELRDFWAPSLLGQAYLGAKEPDRAAAEYRKILDNRGVDGLSPLYPLATKNCSPSGRTPTPTCQCCWMPGANTRNFRRRRAPRIGKSPDRSVRSPLCRSARHPSRARKPLYRMDHSAP